MIKIDAKSVWPGFDYAQTFDISRGVEYYARANRVRAIMVYDKQLPGNTRKTTYVKVQFLDPETGEPIEKTVYNYVTGGREIIDEVRAREIFMRWDEYEDETAHREKQRQEQEALYAEQRAIRQKEMEERREKERLEYAERERIANERRERERIEREEAERKAIAETNAIKTALAARGVATANVHFVNGSMIIPVDVVKRWLGVGT